MRRLVVSLCIVLLLTAVAVANPPGHSKAFGKTLGEWMVGWFELWIGASDETGDKNVEYLPPTTTVEVDYDNWIVYGEGDVTFEPGTAFACSAFFAYGETYDPDLEIPDDDPDNPAWSEDFFTGCDLLVTVDGDTLIDSDADDLADWFYGPEYFDETIEYDAPTGYGAVGAIWIQGLAFVHTPLSVGEHTLRAVLYVPDWGVTFDDTWTITVEP